MDERISSRLTACRYFARDHSSHRTCSCSSLNFDWNMHMSGGPLVLNANMLLLHASVRSHAAWHCFRIHLYLAAITIIPAAHLSLAPSLAPPLSRDPSFRCDFVCNFFYLLISDFFYVPVCGSRQCHGVAGPMPCLAVALREAGRHWPAARAAQPSPLRLRAWASPLLAPLAVRAPSSAPLSRSRGCRPARRPAMLGHDLANNRLCSD